MAFMLNEGAFEWESPYGSDTKGEPRAGHFGSTSTPIGDGRCGKGEDIDGANGLFVWNTSSGSSGFPCGQPYVVGCIRENSQSLVSQQHHGSRTAFACGIVE